MVRADRPVPYIAVCQPDATALSSDHTRAAAARYAAPRTNALTSAATCSRSTSEAIR
jgi:hypothetical protein